MEAGELIAGKIVVGNPTARSSESEATVAAFGQQTAKDLLQMTGD
jgi:hypothetical protein